MSSQSYLRYAILVISALSLLTLGMGCSSKGSNEGGLVPLHAPGGFAGEADIPPWTDSGTTQNAALAFNIFRAQAFGDAGSSLIPNNILYTTAGRHAGYLDSINSRNGTAGEPEANITVDNTYLDLRLQLVVPRIPRITLPRTRPLENVWPAFYTAFDPRARIMTIMGGRNLLQGGWGSTTVYEHYYLDNAGPLLTTDGDLSEYRVVARPQYGFFDMDAAQSLWHHPFARIPLMRPSTKYIGVANKFDARYMNNGSIPPYPLFNGAFGGVMTLVEERYPVTVTRSSYWPANGQTNVNPWGYDGPRDGSFHPHYSGPILHVTLPTTAPVTVLSVGFARVGGDGMDNIGDFTEVVLGEDSRPVDGEANLYVYTAPGQAEVQPLASNFAIIDAEGAELFFGEGGGDGEVSLAFVGVVEAFSFIPLPGGTITRIYLRGAPPVGVGDYVDVPDYQYPDGAEGQNSTGPRIIVGVGPNFVDVERISGIKEGPNPAVANDDDPEVTGAIANFYTAIPPVGGGTTALRNGELMMIPGDPLIPGAWYRVQVFARTTAAGVDFREPGSDVNFDIPFTWWFRVANKQIPLAIYPGH